LIGECFSGNSLQLLLRLPTFSLELIFHFSGNRGGFNGSMQHLDQTRIAMKTKAKDAR
jgi:hypothetical protein